MKGPGLRIDVDVRRVWRCPRCSRVSRRLGDVTFQRCSCTDEGVWMKLEGAPPLRTFPRPPPFARDLAEEFEISTSDVPADSAPVVAPPSESGLDVNPAGDGAGLS